MKDFLERIKAGEILVADGAMGTMLYERGINIHQCPERVNLSGPEILEEIARLYFEAGADIIQTNTFGASPLKLAKYSYDDRTEEIVRNAVRAVRNVVGENIYVSGSCGPCGRILKPYGDTEPDEVYESFVRQMKAFAEAAVDIVCIETMTDIGEATLAVKAAKTVLPSTPVMATMTFDATPRGLYTIMGVDVKTAAARLEQAGADVVGSNCGNGIEKMVEIAQGFRLCSNLPIIIQSNAGLPVMAKGRAVYRETPEFMAEKAKGLISSGVSVIGGCCGTTPAHIAAIREVVDFHPGR
ncbi:MAG: homocysteine S-methyltransferase family protein [Candidatus Zixiibacteriota bacterium]|nr:MAG: homocysteine S-methyltransferase family protein [candidate division Zixibacteria bacterium]